MQCGEDAWPEALFAPTGVATVDGFPGTVGRGNLPPRGAGPCHPQDALENLAVVVRGPTGRRFLGREGGHDRVPVRVAQGGRLRQVNHARRDPETLAPWLACPPAHLTGPRNRLVITPPLRP